MIYELSGCILVAVLAFWLGQVLAYRRCRKYQDRAIAAMEQAQKDMKLARVIVRSG